MGEVPHGSDYGLRGRYGLAICNPVYKSRCKQMQIPNECRVNTDKKTPLEAEFFIVAAA